MAKLPSKDEILQWVAENPTKTNKRDIAKAFRIKGQARIDLKRMLRELQADGHLEKRRKTFRNPDALPPVALCEVLAPDADGDLFARPLEWEGEAAEPRILLSLAKSDPALAAGERILARLQEVKDEDHAYVGRLIRRIGSNPVRVLGIFRKSAEGGRIIPVDKKADKEWLVPDGATNDARDGELVEGELAGPKSRMGLPRVRIVARLGDPSAAKAVSLIAIHQHGIPDDFPDDVIAQADAAKPMGLKGRQDLRDMPLVTIDPSDARDHDDAVFAHADDDPKNEGGHVVWVAIADVAAFVTPGSALDKEARKRGNSSYFPDRVVPMLPDRLSGDLCSLHEGVARPVIAARMVLDAKGEKISHSFVRGMMKSPASLSYEEVQAAQDGSPNERCAELMDVVIAPLYEAYEATKMARARRQPLDLDLPERRIQLSDDGKVAEVAFKDRLDAHKLIEELMVLANVAAAEELNARTQPLLFRVHEEPSSEKLDALREVASASGFNMAKGQVLKTQHLNQLLRAAKDGEFAELINISTLRSMQQAFYGSDNYGHFGLALRNYAHFTSPIRRYADLLVHRALIRGHGWGNDGLSENDIATLDDTGIQISMTERRSMMAERDTTDRYLAAFLNDRVGNSFQGRISGIAKFGVFVKLDDTGADGLLPIRSLGREFFNYDADSQTLKGSETGMLVALGMRVVVKLAEAVPVTGGLILELLEIDGKTAPKSSGSGRRYGKGGGGKGAGKGRKSARDKAKKTKIKKKIERRPRKG
ncbi:MAG: ribonuclease R [Paracoccaceae bacterium]|nr:ribonuclease R [Paracoccaceae bacterium]